MSIHDTEDLLDFFQSLLNVYENTVQLLHLLTQDINALELSTRRLFSCLEVLYIMVTRVPVHTDSPRTHLLERMYNLTHALHDQAVNRLETLNHDQNLTRSLGLGYNDKDTDGIGRPKFQLNAQIVQLYECGLSWSRIARLS